MGTWLAPFFVHGFVITKSLFDYASADIQGFGDLFVSHAQEVEFGCLLGMFLV